MHLQWITGEVHPGLGHLGRSMTERPPPLGLEHPGKRGLRRERNGKKTPSGIKEKKEGKEDAPELDHGRRVMPQTVSAGDRHEGDATAPGKGTYREKGARAKEERQRDAGR